ncbi:MAG TPA: Yip1 family protein [Candidatus Wallbacteria bacterium]|nr:Yip1 family protein [Candidatus Wallbacteria bacterium]
MENFNSNDFIKRLLGFLKSPTQTVRDAIDEEAKTDAIAALALANILALIVTVLMYFYLTYKYRALADFIGGFSLMKMLIKTVFNVNIGFALSVAAYYHVGKAFKGSGSLNEVFIALAMICVPVSILSTIGSAFPVLSGAARILNLGLEYIAVKEAHRFDEPKDVIITAIIASVILYIVGYVISFVF